jgi:hypothetical protein
MLWDLIGKTKEEVELEKYTIHLRKLNRILRVFISRLMWWKEKGWIFSLSTNLSLYQENYLAKHGSRRSLLKFVIKRSVQVSSKKAALKN